MAAIWSSTRLGPAKIAGVEAEAIEADGAAEAVMTAMTVTEADVEDTAEPTAGKF